jgi:hypothetical protein
MRKNRCPWLLQACFVVCAVLAIPSIAWAAQRNHSASELLGTWDGTSVCTDRVAAPACKDEVVIYDFMAAEKPGVVHWNADKIVEGKRLPMGELDLVYDDSEGCWKAEFSSPRMHMVWSVIVKGSALSGNATLLPGKQVVRKIEAHKR